MKAYFRSLLAVDGTHALKDLKTPMLPVFTERVMKAPTDWPSAGKGLGWENAADYTPRRIAGAGALIASEQPDTLASAITAFEAQAAAKH
jgi:hypothetical protein